ncbi:MAG: DUF4230 domain-containing protein [Clostridia bacterium]|nr:DUF4230 domain-containing protein [Clostridia bacterium]
MLKIVMFAAILALLPIFSRYANMLLPDLSKASVNTTIELSHKLSASAKLETNTVDVEAILDSTTDALLIGTVQSVQIAYQYHASIGIDLSKVQLHLDGNTITLELPELEIIADSLTPTTTVKNDFWYPLTEERRQTLLDREIIKCREKYLQQARSSEETWNNTIHAFETYIASWMKTANPRIVLKYTHP